MSDDVQKFLDENWVEPDCAMLWQDLINDAFKTSAWPCLRDCLTDWIRSKASDQPAGRVDASHD